MREQPDICESCEYETTGLAYFENSPGFNRPNGKWLCELCEGSWAGQVALDPTGYRHLDRETLQTICFVGNEIIKEIRNQRAHEE